MIEPESAREWTVFGGASLALMGAALAVSARDYAREHLNWQREWSRAVGAPPPAESGERLALFYRLAGTIIGLIGAAMVPAAGAGRTLGLRAGPADARIIGACLIMVGLGIAVSKLWRSSQSGERWRAADACVWLLCALWAAFGVRLLLSGPV